MLIEITKTTVLDALRNESVEFLYPGEWIGYLLPLDMCPRCAVGAVLLAVLDKNQPRRQIREAITRAGWSDLHAGTPLYNEHIDQQHLQRHAQEILEDGYPLTALSYLFEGLCLNYSGKTTHADIDKESIEAARQDCILFVDERFPETLIADINGGLPAADVRVVEEA